MVPPPGATATSSGSTPLGTRVAVVIPVTGFSMTRAPDAVTATTPGGTGPDALADGLAVPGADEVAAGAVPLDCDDGDPPDEQAARARVRIAAAARGTAGWPRRAAAVESRGGIGRLQGCGTGLRDGEAPGRFVQG